VGHPCSAINGYGAVSIAANCPEPKPAAAIRLSSYSVRDAIGYTAVHFRDGEVGLAELFPKSEIVGHTATLSWWTVTPGMPVRTPAAISFAACMFKNSSMSERCVSQTWRANAV